MALRFSTSGRPPPFSHLVTAWRLTESLSASWDWESPARWRAERMRAAVVSTVNLS